MAYVYGKLKEALIGGDKVGRNFSPNMIKAIFIGRENIMVAYHNRSCRVVRMDINEVMKELGSGMARNESLNNVLNRYKMGCLEEIYADSGYTTVAGGYLDLDRYVQGLTRCRLRYYGWYSGNAEAVMQMYENARIQHNYLYCVAEDSAIRGRILNIQVKSVTGKGEWWRVHDTRVNDYPADAQLEKYFAFVDGEIQKRAELAKKEAEGNAKGSVVERIVGLEVSRVNWYNSYRMLNGLMGNFGDLGYIFREHFFSIQVKEKKRVVGYEGLAEAEVLKRCEKIGMLISKSGKDSTIMLNSCSLEELGDRLAGGRGFWDCDESILERWKSIIRYSENHNMLLRVSLVSAMQSLNMDLRLGMDIRANDSNSMIAFVEEGLKGFERKVDLLLYTFGFNSVESFSSYAKKISGGGK